MPELSSFSTNSIRDLMDALKSDLATQFKDWWKTNKSAVSGQLKALAQSALETQRALLGGKISQELADIALQAQKAAFRQIMRHTKLMTLALLQGVVNTVFARLGAMIRNATGVDFFPELAGG